MPRSVAKRRANVCYSRSAPARSCSSLAFQYDDPPSAEAMQAAGAYDALVVGVPYESFDDSIIYSGGVLGRAEAGDRFGEELASGDFNGDGYDDLIIGAPQRLPM